MTDFQIILTAIDHVVRGKREEHRARTSARTRATANVMTQSAINHVRRENRRRRSTRLRAFRLSIIAPLHWLSQHVAGHAQRPHKCIQTLPLIRQIRIGKWNYF